MHRELQNPLTKVRDTYDRERLVALFPVIESSSASRFLALRDYLDSRPPKFFDQASCDAHLAWLRTRCETHGQKLKQYFARASPEINGALLFLRQINADNPE